MAVTMMNKYVWLVDTIHTAGKITLKEIKKKWEECGLYSGEPLKTRTFHKWKEAVEEMFDLIIENENGGRYRYFISNEWRLESGELHGWLLDTISMSNLIANNQNIRDRILLEFVPSGRQHLETVLQAMKENKTLTVTYQGYDRDEPHTFNINPLCVKISKQRWYMLGEKTETKEQRVYALDRVHSMAMTEETFELPEGFDGDEIFKDSFGVFAGNDNPVADVILKVDGKRVKYLRSLPLHHSQEEIETHKNYSIFKLHIKPTIDFQREILSLSPEVEVLKPKKLRDEIATMIDSTYKIYFNK